MIFIDENDSIIMGNYCNNICSNVHNNNDIDNNVCKD